MKKIYFVGIKGVGMAALAIYCKEKGFLVSGSDVNQEFQTDKLLEEYQIPVKKGFNSKNIDSTIDLLVYSGAYDVCKNEELLQAKKSGLKMMSHGEALGFFMNKKKGIAVAGTHGKTTSTSLLVKILLEAGKDPSYIIGTSNCSSVGSPGHYGEGEYFVAEADEYQTAVNFDKKSRFLWQKPVYALVTNIDYDHPDVFQNIEEVKQSFLKFILNIPKNGCLVYNGDDNCLKEIVNKAICQTISFGKDKRNDYFLDKLVFTEGVTSFWINTRQKKIKTTLHLPGEHNAINVCGVFALADKLGIDNDLITKAISGFRGAKRRFEKIKELKGVLYYDDYAHHPTEVKKTIEAAKSWFPNKRLIVIFQPHTYSRTKSLLKQFTSCFNKADLLILTDIFSSARENTQRFSINGEKFYRQVRLKHKNVYYAKTFSQVIQCLNKNVRSGDLIMTMGAGDIYKVHSLINE